MTYIKLKDVQKPFLKLIEDFPSKEDPIMISAEKVLETINSIPTINPTKVLEEMIEEIISQWVFTDKILYEVAIWNKRILREAINRINQ